jgi:hypothetical protein
MNRSTTLFLTLFEAWEVMIKQPYSVLKRKQVDTQIHSYRRFTDTGSVSGNDVLVSTFMEMTRNDCSKSSTRMARGVLVIMTVNLLGRRCGLAEMIKHSSCRMCRSEPRVSVIPWMWISLKARHSVFWLRLIRLGVLRYLLCKSTSEGR